MSFSSLPPLGPAFVARLVRAVRTVHSFEPSCGWVEVLGSPGMVGLLRSRFPERGDGLCELGGVPVMFCWERGPVSAELVRVSLPDPWEHPSRVVADVEGLSDPLHDVFVQFRRDGLEYGPALGAARSVLA